MGSLPGSDIDTPLTEESDDLLSPNDPDLEPLMSEDNVEIPMNECPLASPQSRRARKRTEQCEIGNLENPGNLGKPGNLDNPDNLGNPGSSILKVPTSDSTFDWAQEALQKRWCSETTSLIFGNIPVCAVVALPVTGLFENVNSYLCK